MTLNLAVGCESATSGRWSGVGDFRQLEWSWWLQAVGVELQLVNGKQFVTSGSGEELAVEV